jgi:hypothetical protein
MKYIIPKTRLKKLMWSYLNEPDYNVLGGEFVDILVVRIEDKTSFAYDYKDQRLAVSNDVVFGLISLFNMDDEDALDYIGEWFEETYNLGVMEIVNMELG